MRAKRIIYNGNQNTGVDYIPYVGGAAQYAYVGGVRIPHWTAAAKRPTVNMTVNNTPAPYVALASSENGAARYQAWAAFSGNNTYGWTTAANQANAWIQIKLDKPLKSVTVTLQNRSSSPVAGAISGGIFGSDNGTASSWTRIALFSGRNGTTASASTTVVCDNHNDAYQYIRVYVGDWDTKSSGGYLSIGQISINGKEET